MNKPILSLSDVCDRVGRSRQWVWYSVRNGTFPEPIRLGLRAIAWLPVQIEKWEAEQQQKHEQAEA